MVDPARYRLERDSQRPAAGADRACVCRLIPAGGVGRDRVSPPGSAPAWGDLPADLAQAVLLLAAHYYEYRERGDALAQGCMPFGVSALIERYRTVRMFGEGAR